MEKSAGRLLRIWNGNSKMMEIILILLLALGIAGMIMLSG